LAWQQIQNLRTTFCRVPQGELTAKNGSIPPRNKKKQFEEAWQTDIGTEQTESIVGNNDS